MICDIGGLYNVERAHEIGGIKEVDGDFPWRGTYFVQIRIASRSFQVRTVMRNKTLTHPRKNYIFLTDLVHVTPDARQTEMRNTMIGTPVQRFWRDG